MSQTTLASLSGVRKRFGKIQALDGFDLAVNRGELLAVLGPEWRRQIHRHLDPVRTADARMKARPSCSAMHRRISTAGAASA